MIKKKVPYSSISFRKYFFFQPLNSPRIKILFIFLTVLFCNLLLSHVANTQPYISTATNELFIRNHNQFLNRFPKTERYNHVTGKWLLYPEIPIDSIQWNSYDSLRLLDSLQTLGNWKWQASRLAATSETLDDTVTITALCVVPAKVLGYTASGFTMLLYDTASNNTDWGGIFVKVNAPSDTQQCINDGFLNIERGDIIKITGRISEFPSNNVNSFTQFQPIPGISIDSIGTMEVPPPIDLGDSTQIFYEGSYQSSGPYHVHYSAGEQYESMVVTLHHLTIAGYENIGGRNNIFMIDGKGNTIAMFDASKWFTVSGSWRDPGSTWTLPPVNTVIDKITGYITVVSGASGTHGYVLAPIYPDLNMPVVQPSLNQHSRTPILVTSEDSATIFVHAQKQLALWSYDISHVSLFVSVDNNSFDSIPMVLFSLDTTYFKGVIPPQAQRAFVRYFIKAFDDSGNTAILAGPDNSSDTSNEFFFYTVTGSQPTIKDIQYTPYANGKSPYVGA